MKTMRICSIDKDLFLIVRIKMLVFRDHARGSLFHNLPVLGPSYNPQIFSTYADRASYLLLEVFFIKFCPAFLKKEGKAINPLRRKAGVRKNVESEKNQLMINSGVSGSLAVTHMIQRVKRKEKYICSTCFVRPCVCPLLPCVYFIVL